MQLLSAILGLIAIGILGRNFIAFVFAWLEMKDTIEENAWFNTWTTYAAAAAFFLVSLTVVWCMDAVTYEERAALAFVIGIAMHWLASAIPNFNFPSTDETMTPNAR